MSINMGYIMIHPKKSMRITHCESFLQLDVYRSYRLPQIQTCATRRLTMMSIPPMKLKKKKKMMKTFRAKNEKKMQTCNLDGNI